MSSAPGRGRSSSYPELSAAFDRFAVVEARELGSPMYAELAMGVARDDDLLALAAQRRERQPAPNMLFASVQYLLLSGVSHPLAAHYPILSRQERPEEQTFPLFRGFCLDHRAEIGGLLVARATQTQVVQRCTCLLPAFGIIQCEARNPLALVDVGASAGLNLLFDRYFYRYLKGGRELSRWGRRDASVRLEADLRGPIPPPEPPRCIEVASRQGIDIHPVDLSDPDELLWLRALIWPEHVERHRQLSDAAEELEKTPVDVQQGDATTDLPRVLDAAPPAAALVVYSTIALYQAPPERRPLITQALREKSRERPVWQVALEGLHPPELTLTRYRDGAEPATELLAEASPHGWWMEWRTATGAAVRDWRPARHGGSDPNAR